MAYLIGLSDATRKPSVWGKAQDGAPTDRQMLTWDTAATRWEYQWPGMTNFSENRTFTILPSGSTVAQINTALTDYDVVYLEAGTYTMGGTPIAIGTGKALIGLGDSSWGNTNGVYIDGSAGATGANFITLNNGYLSNVTCYAATAQAHDIVSGNTTNYANYADRVNVATVAADNACFAFAGGFVRVDRFRIDNINGVWFNKSSYSLYGPSLFTNFVINNAPTYGFYLEESLIKIDNGYITSNAKATDYGIYYNTSTTYANHWISHVRLYQCVNGIFYSFTTNPPYRVFIDKCDADSCTTGFSIYGLRQSSISNCTAISCSTSGFNISSINFVSVTGCSAAYCTQTGFTFDSNVYLAAGNLSAYANNGTAGLGNGNFKFNANSGCSFTSMVSGVANNTNNAGFYIAACNMCVFDGLFDYMSTYGVYVAGAFSDVTIANVETYDPSYCGFYTDGNLRTRITLNGISSYSACASGGSAGIVIQFCDYSVFSNLRSGADATTGVYIFNCDNSEGGNWASSNSGGQGIYVGFCTYCAFSSLVSYFAGSRGIYFDTCTGVVINGGVVYQSSITGVYLVNCSYCRISDSIASTNRTNGALSHGFWLDTGNVGNALVECTAYANRRDGFNTTNATNSRSTIVGCLGVANSQEAGGTYYNFRCQAIGTASSLAATNLSVRAGQTFNPGASYQGDWNSTANADVA